MQTKEIIEEVSKVLNIPPVGRQILFTLSSHRKGLFLKEVVNETKRSERAIKHHLKRLHQFGLVCREVVKTERGQTAYLYSFPRIRDFLKSARLELFRRAKRLKKLGGGNRDH